MLTENVLAGSIHDLFYQVHMKNTPSTCLVDLTLSSSSQLDLSSRNTTLSNTSSSDFSASISSADLSSSNTDNTLNMISTPWTTESWSEESMAEAFETYSEPDQNTIPYTSSSLQPVSTSSDGITLDINSASGITVTILEMNEPRSCFSIKLDPVLSETKTQIDKRRYIDSSSTLDSWTVEPFTSLMEYSDSNIVKVRYPWSPSTCQSGTDFYPDSLDTLPLNAFSLKSPTLESVKHDKTVLIVFRLHVLGIIQ